MTLKITQTMVDACDKLNSLSIFSTTSTVVSFNEGSGNNVIPAPSYQLSQTQTQRI